MLINRPTAHKSNPPLKKKSVKPKKSSKDTVALSSDTKTKNKYWEMAKKGYKKTVAQSYTASSVSLSLRLGSRQVDGLLGTGIASAMGSAGIALGFAAAGLRVAGGTEKLVQSVKTKKFSRALDGLKDYGAAGVLGLTCAGMWAARKIALPAAAGFETFRGGYNFAAGYLTGDKKRQAQGVYDGIRAAGRTARALKKFSPFLKTAGLILAPVAGAMQINKGLKNLSLGLKKNNNKLELRGLVDIASAVGTTMLLTGIAGVPGMAIFGTAQFLNTSYRMSGTVRKVVDPVIDKMEPAGHKVADGIRNLKMKASELWEKFPNPFGLTTSDESPTEENEDSSIWYNECFLPDIEEPAEVVETGDAEVAMDDGVEDGDEPDEFEALG